MLRKITGISTPFGGFSWRAGIDDREEVIRLSLFLEDRRVLYNRFDNEQAHFVVESVRELRTALVDTLKNIGPLSKAAPHIRGMQAECRRFLDDVAATTKQASEFEYIFQSVGMSPTAASLPSFTTDVAETNKRSSQFEKILGDLGKTLARKGGTSYYIAVINFYTALGSFRRGFGDHFCALCDTYGIDSPLLNHFQSLEQDRAKDE
jgi:hypothetical protein